MQERQTAKLQRQKCRLSFHTRSPDDHTLHSKLITICYFFASPADTTSSDASMASLGHAFAFDTACSLTPSSFVRYCLSSSISLQIINGQQQYLVFINMHRLLISLFHGIWIVRWLISSSANSRVTALKS